MTLNAEQDLREKVIGMIFTFLLHFRLINYFIHWRCLDKGKLFNCSSSNSVPGVLGDFTNNFMKCYKIFACFKIPWTNTTRFTWTRIGNFHQKLFTTQIGSVHFGDDWTNTHLHKWKSQEFWNFGHSKTKIH